MIDFFKSTQFNIVAARNRLEKMIDSTPGFGPNLEAQ